MIAHLRGQVAVRRDGATVVDVNGIGYLVHVTTGERIPAVGERVELFTSMQVREESITLYGFRDRNALELFETLLGSSGVGPKLALAALGTHRPAVLRTAIATGDLATLTAIPGVGKKVAERLVLELREKMTAADLEPLAVPARPAPGPEPQPVDEVRDALLGLGYTPVEVQSALTAVGVADHQDAAGLLRRTLRLLGAGTLDGVAR